MGAAGITVLICETLKEVCKFLNSDAGQLMVKQGIERGDKLEAAINRIVGKFKKHEGGSHA